jgi:hypothetical protein
VELNKTYKEHIIIPPDITASAPVTSKHFVASFNECIFPLAINGKETASL